MATRYNQFWKSGFSKLLKSAFEIYKLNYYEFAEKYYFSTSTIRYWLSGRNLPQPDSLSKLCEFLSMSIVGEGRKDQLFSLAVSSVFEGNDANDALEILDKLQSIPGSSNEFVVKNLAAVYALAKGENPLIHSNSTSFPLSGRTMAVVFDFDGTLTKGKTNRTTWESLWSCLGYDIKICQELHQQFDRKEISHAKWCKLTEDYFRKRNLNRTAVEHIASKIKLIPGVKETFRELNRRDIRIYIVSGSILQVIEHVLKENVRGYVTAIKANEFRFDANGCLKEIIGTRYDFEGKARYIRKISEEHRISPSEILFVGNSINDRFAYRSGAKTLCINPKLTDISNTEVWNDCIQTCENLKEILKFIV